MEGIMQYLKSLNCDRDKCATNVKENAGQILKFAYDIAKDELTNLDAQLEQKSSGIWGIFKKQQAPSIQINETKQNQSSIDEKMSMFDKTINATRKANEQNKYMSQGKSEKTKGDDAR